MDENDEKKARKKAEDITRIAVGQSLPPGVAKTIPSTVDSKPQEPKEPKNKIKSDTYQIPPLKK
ncbi:MAG: hypothetical protein NTV25_03695 [Methanothrix sp.]|nr:hypothetical protein [Methanothrix sp.]